MDGGRPMMRVREKGEEWKEKERKREKKRENERDGKGWERS